MLFLLHLDGEESGRRSSPRSDKGSGGKKDSNHENYWKILEGEDSDSYEQVLKDEQSIGLADFSATDASFVVLELLNEEQLCDPSMDSDSIVRGIHYRKMWDYRVSPNVIAVQSPYIAQVKLLRDRLDTFPGASGVEVATIDSFQGREADAVIISMVHYTFSYLVRSNTLGAVGFLGDSRRMNVAITRARKLVAVVCDSSTICHNTFLARLLRHIRRFGRIDEPSFPYVPDSLHRSGSINRSSKGHLDNSSHQNTKEKQAMNWTLIAQRVHDILRNYPLLHLTHGRKVLEICTIIDWNKGKAVNLLLECLGLNDRDDILPIYIGYDRTDKDVFKVLTELNSGYGILVSSVPKETNAH
ncbi:putative trehalose-phosphate phosphatase F [Dendrobium catenatum]|uniref:Putative trehalose-phosphate phosphatase F n=1 Tax=Dendrobium catenatum TaxID=906689 RepID=A0A2I0W3M8_9ASPA|nr:putative trehalose-phosphate phosphatase F [Dendrobium catenatum]